MEKKKSSTIEFLVDGKPALTSWERGIRSVHPNNPITDFTEMPVCAPRYGSHAFENDETTRG